MRGSRKALKKGTYYLGQIKRKTNLPCQLTLPRMKPCKPSISINTTKNEAVQIPKAPCSGTRGRLKFPFCFSVQDVKCPHRENGEFLSHGPKFQNFDQCTWGGSRLRITWGLNICIIPSTEPSKVTALPKKTASTM